jgi:hypothetical protein
LAKLWSKLDYFRSQAARRDDLINVSDVGDEPDKGKRCEHEALEHGLDLPNDFCWSAGRAKRFNVM